MQLRNLEKEYKIRNFIIICYVQKLNKIYHWIHQEENVFEEESIEKKIEESNILIRSQKNK